ncbi:unnamed protein product [Commensalibacter communis]|uniref:Uncharacterized protein n=1 Tax=Commensalibacter communis TaxID=2972786 RepID=A0A9W4TPH1_9PROT|nr:hypothetical protein [Commensalibacter communis]CAI3941602.1 unnamed protein product [Commensalibacter communis]CAI3945025.1 unnamed protein product [Commensalibacter communis]CAI3959204.1 unnamed protein product [Commensalibacter communis]CAI3960878.1 unnamed protein product [Commensalibacter communis]
MIRLPNKVPCERRIHVLPKELLEKIRKYQMDYNISSEVETVRRLLNEALDRREVDNKKAVDLSPNVPTASYQIPTKGNVYNEQ